MTDNDEKVGYGACPMCGAPGVNRERRPNGDDTCANGHKYPSAKAVRKAMTQAPVTDAHRERARSAMPEIHNLLAFNWDEAVTQFTKVLATTAAEARDAALEEAAKLLNEDKLAQMIHDAQFGVGDWSLVMGFAEEQRARKAARAVIRALKAVNHPTPSIHHRPSSRTDEGVTPRRL